MDIYLDASMVVPKIHSSPNPPQISGGGSNRFLRAFDEYEDKNSVKGPQEGFPARL
jgi:hypothetical protein